MLDYYLKHQPLKKCKPRRPPIYCFPTNRFHGTQPDHGPLRVFSYLVYNCCGQAPGLSFHDAMKTIAAS